MALRIALGSSSFRALREAGGTYVDKSLLIRDLIDDHAAAILLPRPRRFGKTTNLSMLRSYFEKSREPLWPLFQDLAIAQAGPAYHAHFQRYPVIYLTFKDIKENRWGDCEAAVARLIATVYAEHRYLLDEGGLSPEQHRAFLEILQRQARGPALSGALQDLSLWLWRHHGEKVVILLDEYDTPLHTAYLKDYYEDAVAFFRNLVESNRETGLGRSDLMIAPKTAGQPGVVIELKVKRRNEDMQRAVEAAFRQLEDRRYAASLRARGADPVWEFAVAFDGKEVTCKRRPA